MRTHLPQPGIFALGTPAHAYLELDLVPGADVARVLADLAGFANGGTTDGVPDAIVGANVVIGLHPRLCEQHCPGAMPIGTRPFEQPIVGDDGFTMPATQHDLVVWVSGAAYDHVFDIAQTVITLVAASVRSASDARGWPDQHDRDLTGFIDGTENPPVAEALEIAVVPHDQPGVGSSVLLLQTWSHDIQAWTELSVTQQEHTMGRTKPDSVELDPKPATSHAARTDQDEVGKIFRRNMPYGTVSDHGTMFVGFAASQAPFERMLRRMAGVDGEPRDELTRFTTPLSGAYYVIPSMQRLAELAGSGATES